MLTPLVSYKAPTLLAPDSYVSSQVNGITFRKHLNIILKTFAWQAGFLSRMANPAALQFGRT
jgi:hypothetical protein